jgi:hypothetical protein
VPIAARTGGTIQQPGADYMGVRTWEAGVRALEGRPVPETGMWSVHADHGPGPGWSVEAWDYGPGTWMECRGLGLWAWDLGPDGLY